ncbi:MAG: ThuA domain-containing protein [Planctomycetota bacterium]
MKMTLNKICFVFVMVGLLTGLTGCNSERAYNDENLKNTEKIKIAIITGGHGFDKEPFLEMFSAYDDIEFVHLHQEDDSEIFENIDNWPYNVIVLYNMSQKITEKRQENFLRLLNNGVGVVSLHHSIAAFKNWPEYQKIIGAKYYLDDTVVDGVLRKKSRYKHGINIAVNIVDKTHPITRGMSDFVILDEAYKDSAFEPDNHVLITTDEPASDRSICWVRHYKTSRVCYIQLGHDKVSYADQNYRKLVQRAVQWCSKRR